MSQEKSAPGEIAHSGALELSEFKRGRKILPLAVLGITTSVTWLYAFSTFVMPMEQPFHRSSSDIQATFFCGSIPANSLIGWLNFPPDSDIALMTGILFKLAGNYSLVLGYFTVVFRRTASLLLLGRYPKFEPGTAG